MGDYTWLVWVTALCCGWRADFALVRQRKSLMQIGLDQPFNGRILVAKDSGPKAPLVCRVLGVLEAVERRVRFRHEGKLESCRNPDHVERDDDVSSRQVPMGILPDAYHEHPRELVLESQAGKGPIALLHVVGAAVADVGAHVLPRVVDPAIGMRPGELHSAIPSNLHSRPAGELPTDNYKNRMLQNAGC